MVIGSQRQLSKTDVKAMFVVPKKKFKNAHDRNKLKRRMREAYRLQKTDLYTKLGPIGMDVAFIYYGNKPEEYTVIYQAFNKLLTALMP